MVLTSPEHSNHRGLAPSLTLPINIHSSTEVRSSNFDKIIQYPLVKTATFLPELWIWSHMGSGLTGLLLSGSGFGIQIRMQVFHIEKKT